MRIEDGARGRLLILAAVTIVTLTLALRAPWLGRLGLQGDEDISTLAFRGILSSGVPVLPSGNEYWRAPLYSYLAAPLAASGTDWLPRVLSVLLACATAVLLIRLGSRWVGRSAALLGALFFALSLVEIHTARQARFYALYQPLALLVLYALDRFAETGAVRWGVASMGAGLAAMASHELGVTLAALFVLPVLRPLRRRVQLAAVGMAGVFGLLSLLQRSLIGASMSGGLPTIAGTLPRNKTGPLAEMMAAGAPVLALALVAALFGLLGWWAARERAALDRLLAAAGFAIVAGAAGAHQIGAALGGLIALVLTSPDLLPGERGRTSLGVLGISLVLGGGAWLAFDLAHGTSLRHAVRELGGGPLVIGTSLLRPAAVAVPALLGAVAVLASAVRGRSIQGPRFLLLCIAILAVVRGLLASKIVDRYMADVWPLWELLAGWAIVEGTRRAAAGLPAWRGASLPWATAAVVAAAVLLLPGTAPAETVHYLRRGPGVSAKGIVPAMVPDLRGAARFVREHAAPGDRIAATDWLTTYCYLGRVDLWLRSDAWAQQAVLVGGVPRDIYVGARVVPTLGDLAALRGEGPLWIIAGGLELFEQDRKLDPTLREFLRREPAVFEAADGWTRVLRLDPDPGRSRR